MATLLCLVIVAAIGQHEWYHYLDGRARSNISVDQSWAIRIGTYLAFVFKVCLVAAVGIAFTQGFWYSVRRHAIRVEGLDAMLGVLSNPFKFLKKDLLFTTTHLMILAIISWILPLTAVLSPGSLTGYTPSGRRFLIIVVSRPVTTDQVRDVPSIGALDSDVGFVSIGTVGTYLGATQQLRRVAARVLTSGQTITWPSPCGSNCTYTISFPGPAYQCSDLDSLPSNVVLGTAKPAGNGYPNNTVEPFNYIAAGRFQLGPVWQFSPDLQGLWIIRRPVPRNITTQCRLYEATYTTQVNYSDNIQSLNTSVSYGDQILGSAADGYHDVYPASLITPRSWTLMNMFSIAEAVGEVLSGYVTQSSSYGGYNFVDTMIAISDLATPYPFNFTFAANFPQKIEQLLINTTLSVIYFLDNPPITQIVTENASMPAVNTSVAAITVSFNPQYSYSATTLWEIYGIALGVAFLAVLAGGYMLP